MEIKTNLQARFLLVVDGWDFAQIVFIHLEYI